MPTKLKITIFDVTKCGYYKRRESIPEFGGIADILVNLGQWVKNKTLLQTATFTADGEEFLETYCFDLNTGSKGNYLLTTWNKIPMTEGGVQTANPSNTVGHVSVQLAKVATGNIPGYAAFFYFMPRDNLCIAIRPYGQSHNGHQPLIKYMQGFLEKASKYVVLNKESTGDDIEILGYSVDGNIDEANIPSPAYSSRPKRLPGQEDFLRKNRVLIRKVVKKDRLDLTIQSNKSFVDKVLNFSGIIKAPPTTTKELRFNYEIEFSPSEEEFEELVSQYKLTNDESSEIGFKLTGGGSETHWLSHINAKGEIEVGIEVDESGVLPPEKLISEIEKHHLPRLMQLAGIR